MKIDDDLIDHLENLSYLSLSTEERKRIGTDLENILEGMVLLSNADINFVSSNEHSTEINSELRKDIVIPSYPQSEILRNAPSVKNNLFAVKKQDKHV